jgi:phage terminase small subunit
MIHSAPHLIPEALPANLPQPPSDLEPEEKEIWCGVVRQCPPAATTLLVLALRQHAHARFASEVIAREGMLITNKRGQPRPHPMVRVEREATKLFRAIFKQLGLVGGIGRGVVAR